MKRAVLVGAVATALVAALLLLLRRDAPTPVAPEAGPPPEATASTASVTTEPTALALDPVRLAAARKQRDELRERIYRSLGATPPPAALAAAGGGGAHPRPSVDAGPLDATYLRERIREDFVPMARQCYEAAAAHAPKLAGRVDMEFTIVGDDANGGIVEDASVGEGSTLLDAKMSECLTQSMLAMSFKAPGHGGTTTVRYPMTFSRDEPDE